MSNNFRHAASCCTKKLLFMLTISMAAAMVSNGQTLSSATPSSPDSTHVMLHPDENTQYMNELGSKIDAQQFATSLQTGQFSFEPEMENGRIKNMRLKKAGKTVTAGDAAQNFSVTDIYGKHYALKELKGKIVVMNFWFTGCMPCVQEIPELNDLVTKYASNTNVVFLAVTYDAVNTVKKFIAKKPFMFNIVADEAALIKRYGITGFPTSIVIDKNGGVAFSLTSYNSTNAVQLDGVITALLRRK